MNKIDSLISKIDFSELEKNYIEKDVEDLSSYKIVIKKQDTLYAVRVYGNIEPQELKNLSNLCNNIYRIYHFSSHDSIIKFKSAEGLYPPPPPPPKNGHSIHSSFDKFGN